MEKLTLRQSVSIEFLRLAMVVFLATSLCANPALGWGPEGHRIVAMIAAAHLSDGAQAGTKTLLESDPAAKGLLRRNPRESANSLAKAMAAVANWADDVKKQTDTGEWHFLDLASSDQKARLGARCPGGECVTEKIRTMKPNLKSGKSLPHGSRSFTPTEQLKFIIHLMGDLHQPLHCATNADAGGNCLRTAGFKTSELHAAWDGGMIRVVLLKGTTEADLARTLDTRFSGKFSDLVKISDVDDMALESHEVAFKAAYGPILDKHLLPGQEPRPFLRLRPRECATKAPDFFNINPHPSLTKLYSDATFDTVRQQLATGGFRLAELLNTAFE